jgi:hypothetical protein
MLNLSRVLLAVGIAAASGLTFGFVSSKADPQGRYQASVQRADARFQAEQARCQKLPAGPLRLCLAVALSEKWRAVAAAQVKLNDTPETRHSQRVINASGALLVALEKCASGTTEERSACRGSAKDSFLREMSRVRAEQAREEPCYPAQCTWDSGFKPSRNAVITSI